MSKKKYAGPRYGDLFLDVLKVVADMGGSASNEEMLNKVIERRNFSDDIVEFYKKYHS